MPALGLLLLSPLLARAEAPDDDSRELMLLGASWGLALLLVLLSLLAYRRPASPTLRWLNYAGIGLSLVLGLAGLFFAKPVNNSLSGLGEASPFLRLSLPVAAWLGGASWAACTTRPRARQWGVAVAAAGALPIASILLKLPTRWLTLAAVRIGMSSFVALALLKLLPMVGAWWVVLVQAQRRRPLGWHTLRPVLLVPALATGLGLACTYLPYVGSLEPEWLALALLGFLADGLLSCTIGALVIWLNQRRQVAARSSAPGTG